MVRPVFVQDSPGTRVIILGNEALARGALEAGVRVAAGYPGTPATEIIETLATISKYYPDIYVEWSINEKVGFETAFAGSMCGVRSIACMKHVGLNVALDSFVTASYAGARGGFVLVSVDDPDCHSSQNEQDNRQLAKLAFCPVFEPANANEAKEMIKFAFDFSEQYQTLVMLRSTTRLSHSQQDVKLGEIPQIKKAGKFDHDKSRWTFLPVNARIQRKVMLERMERIREAVESNPFNKMMLNENSRTGILAAGLSHTYVSEYLEKNDFMREVSYLKLATTFPPPRKLIGEFVSNLDRILVVEELEPFIEEYVIMYAKEFNPALEIIGKKLLPQFGELSPEITAEAINNFLEKRQRIPTQKQKIQNQQEIKAPPRPPVLCPGCPHRAFFYALKLAEKRSKTKFIYSSDIGCYTLGFYPPLETIETCLCMGASIGMANGFSKAGEDSPIFAILGDSTFFHAGVPGLINLVYNGSKVIVVVLDNGTTAMTGHQPHPGTGFRIDGSPSPKIQIEKIAEGCGVKYIRVTDPYNLKNTVDTILEAVSLRDGPALIISRQDCTLVSQRKKREANDKIIPYKIDKNKCTKCRLCITTLGCPAFLVKGDEVEISQNLCFGCAICQDLCPAEAIQKSETE
ncbi:MAG: indolepyruvate ferredoxin oxidoreductase subunit alpha [Candidatus Jordarchaeum sp.]|uniref:indolepyruvate ferredoxin oxidoreductase subunit alpha n=1 Tax=Candidatus Jordarchaeum sp. TaxID=2823881 RepID=UPI00404B788D